MFNEQESAQINKELGEGKIDGKAIDEKIEKNIKKRELEKIKDNFYTNIKEYYQKRKVKEFATLKCSSLCFNREGENYTQDSMTRMEKHCMINCFHKTYRYLVHANTAYSFFTGNEELINEQMKTGDEQPELGLDNKITDIEGNERRIPSREEMELMS